jgi:type I restriction enzyme S subunit
MNLAPKGWSVRQIGELADVARGSSPRPIADQTYFVGGHIPWIKIADATKSGKYLYDTKEKVNEYGASFSRILPAGSLIIAASGTLGYPQMLGVSGCVHDGWLYLTNFRGVDRHFLYYFFHWKKQHFYNSAYGAAIQNINTEILRKTEIALPPLVLQERIASVLSTYDDLIENNTRRIRILEEIAQMIYREWFVNFRFPGHEKVKMVESEMGPIPDGWRVESVGTASVNFDSKRRPLSSMERATRKGPYPYYGAAKIFDFIDSYIFDGRYLLIAEDGSVTTSDRKPVLQLTGGKFWPNNHTHVLQGKSPVSTYLLYLSLREVDVSGYVTGAAQPKITQANLNRIPITVAPTPLLKTFDEICSPLLDQVAVMERTNTNLRTTRDLLLPKLISGEVSVDNLKAAAVA